MKKGFWSVAIKFLVADLHERLEVALFGALNAPFTLIRRPLIVLAMSVIYVSGLFGPIWLFRRGTVIWKVLFQTRGCLIIGVILTALTLIGISTGSKSVWKIGRSRIARLKQRTSALMQELKLLAGPREDTGSGKRG